jgi:small subunit ribosomal protein S5
MAEYLDDSGAIESTTVGVYRTAATVKGGRRFSFSSLVVVGDRNGRVGIGYGKANQVPPAIEKAQKEGRRRMKPYPRLGNTIPHEVEGRFGACRVRLIPASPGTGVIASSAIRAPLEMMGIQDCLTKSYGSNNSKNLVKAVMNGLGKLRSKEQIEELRGLSLEKTEVEASIERGAIYLQSKKGAEEAETDSEPAGEGGAATATAEPPDAKAEEAPKATSGDEGGGEEKTQEPQG